MRNTSERVKRELTRPVLLWEVPSEAQEDPESQRTQMQTDLSSERPAAGEPMVFDIRKAVGKVNAFAQEVTVGRSDSNDIVLVDTSVSRFHAYFMRDRKTESWTVVDASSRFGTFIDGVQLPPNQPTAIDDLQPIRFGQVDMVFYAPSSFLELLERKAKG